MKITVDLTREEAAKVKEIWDWEPNPSPAILAADDKAMNLVFSVRHKIVKAIKGAGQ